MYLGVCCLSRLYSLISNIPKNMKKSYLFYPLGCRTGYTVLKIMPFFSFCLSKKKVHIYVCVRTYTGLLGGPSGKEHSGTQWKSLSPVWLFATPWTIQSTEFSRPECCNTIQSTEFSRPGYCSGYVAVPFSRGSSQPSDWTQVSHIAGRFFTSWATREAQWWRTCPQRRRWKRLQLNPGIGKIPWRKV